MREQRAYILNSDRYWATNNLEIIPHHGTGNSKVAVTKQRMVELNNQKISDREIQDFLVFINYTQELTIKIKRPVKRNFGRSSSVGRWISLRRPSVWVFLHELAHQFIPRFVEQKDLENGRYQIPQIDDIPYQHNREYRGERKMFAVGINYEQVVAPKPHGYAFGEVLTKLHIAWSAFKDELNSAQRSTSRCIASIEFWRVKSNQASPAAKEKKPKQVLVNIDQIFQRTPAKKAAPPKKKAHSNKMEVWLLWGDDCDHCREIDHKEYWEAVNQEVKLSTIKQWVRWWEKGKHLPKR